MKGLTLCLAIAAIGILTASAQEGDRKFRTFKGDMSLGYALPLGSNADGGGLFAWEPKFRLMDQLYLGLRIEAALMARSVEYLEDVKLNYSYVATGDYYFTNNYSFRPFVGAGAGWFNITNEINQIDYGNDDKFGGIIRAGGEVKHFRFGIEYNIIPSSTYSLNGNTVTYKNNYIGLKLGFCFGGGPLQ